MLCLTFGMLMADAVGHVARMFFPQTLQFNFPLVIAHINQLLIYISNIEHTILGTNEKKMINFINIRFVDILKQLEIRQWKRLCRQRVLQKIQHHASHRVAPEKKNPER